MTLNPAVLPFGAASNTHARSLTTPHVAPQPLPHRSPSTRFCLEMLSPTARVLQLLALCLLVSTLLGNAWAAGRWYTGRATFYDDNREGSCCYSTSIPTHYAAWVDPENAGDRKNCGKCFEVECVNRVFSDGYGQRVSRTDACYDESKAIIVKIVDSCPCIHENAYSNQRWCCGDAAHIDIGSYTFSQLSDPSNGVIGARWREVPCPDDSNDTGSTGTMSDSDNDDGNEAPPAQRDGVWPAQQAGSQQRVGVLVGPLGRWPGVDPGGA